jgi:uncharacterized protein YjaG (DUF416 family)
MKIRGFGGASILSQLARLPQRHRVAYASACAERLLPLYTWFQGTGSWGDSTVLDRGISLAWNWAKGQAEGKAIRDAIAACEEVTPDTEDFSSGLVSRALDAAAAVAQALETCLDPSPETAAQVGEIAWECAFGLEQSLVSEPGTIHFASMETLSKLAQGRFVLLEENLQQESLHTLRNLTLSNQEIDEFREKYGKLNDARSAM